MGGDQPDGNPSNDAAAQSTTVSEVADLALTKTADPGMVAQGDPTRASGSLDNLIDAGYKLAIRTRESR